MKRIHTTNILLGVIAAEVVFLTARAIADRQAANAVGCFDPKRRKPDEAPGQSLSGQSFFGRAWHRVSDSLRRLFYDSPEKAGHSSRERIAGDFREEWRERAAHPGMSGYNDHGQYDEERAQAEDRWERDGGRNGGRPRTTAPWTREASDIAPDADTARAQAERAVPMPNSAQYTQRLDRNQYVGNGMRSHDRH